ncbi:interleukin-1 receptor type 2 [Phyllopteryx taeniolatus]|uniref:interleukin-1 receptor type 2 n=1 Tax=Phyllopteryx taeniolatus TaxID=161469 RepID=UPI002AD26CB5|nr:interleukin-1 receptor type 2 [Phyllopteryx taeniolatus]XP_061649390.1 interleukin-1 receptor type 2 [Phyllopteryx taeniolatus]
MSAILALMMLAVEFADGRRFALPAMPVKDGCFTVLPEIELFRLESEAVMLSFPGFRSALKVRDIVPPDDAYRIAKNNRTSVIDGGDDSEGRVQQRGTDLWLLPARPSDSGEYTCTFRNATFCIRGSVTLQVYASSSADMDKLSYEYNAMLGENVTLRCPAGNHLSETRIQWVKDSSGAVGLQAHRWWSFRQDAGKLQIPSARLSDAGLYTCRLRVLVDFQEYRLTGTVRLLVKGRDQSATSEPELTRPPLIISPLNGSVLEVSHGSGLEVTCTVLTDCHVTRYTAVRWWVDGIDVDVSHLNGRALQATRKESRVASGCQVEVRMVVMAMAEAEEGTELTCVAQNQVARQEVTITLHVEDSTLTWLVTACVSTSCFLAVVFIFLYVLVIKPKQKEKKKKKADYFLARQDSAF